MDVSFGIHPDPAAVIAHLSDTHLLAGGAQLAGLVDTEQHLRDTAARLAGEKFSHICFLGSGALKAVAVESALKAKSSDAGAAALGKGWTITEALIMAEFESDEEASAELESVIMDEPDQLLHVAQQLLLAHEMGLLNKATDTAPHIRPQACTAMSERP